MGTLISSTELMNRKFKEGIDMAISMSMPSTIEAACMGISEETIEMFKMTKEVMDSLSDLANEYAVTIERMEDRLKRIEEKLDELKEVKED